MEALAAFAIAATLISKIVEHVRRYIPAIDGVYVFAFASALGGVFVAGTDVRFVAALLEGVEVAGWLDAGVSAFGLGAGAGFVNDLTK